MDKFEKWSGHHLKFSERNETSAFFIRWLRVGGGWWHEVILKTNLYCLFS